MGAPGKAATARIPHGIWAKVIIPGGFFLLLLLLLPSSFFFIAEMEFRPIIAWPKRAYHRD